MFRRNRLAALLLRRPSTYAALALPAFAVVALSAAGDATSAAPNMSGPFPYTARVVGEDVYVRSGPGTDYYPTAKLQAGDFVEVYRRDPGGWCAIKPPRNSFCYVAFDKLKPLGDSVAVAKESKVEVRVGSALGDMRDVIQVRLDRDEPVEVLEEPDRGRPDAWVKIAPPAGEFRWISSRFLDHHAHVNSPSQLKDRDRPAEPRRWTQAAPAAPSAWVPRGASRAGGAPSREIERLNHELSARVVQDIWQWRFDDLKQRGARMFDEAPTDADRDDARQFLAKIERFEDIRMRREAFERSSGLAGGGNAGGGASGAGLTATRLTISPPAAVDPRYDGTGRLQPVVSPRAGAPRFALIDATGAVTRYVAPAPGVNLQPYVNKRIGVSGPCSYMPEYQTQMISAQRVTLLDDGTRRF